MAHFICILPQFFKNVENKHCFIFFKVLFICLWRKRKGGRKRETGSSICPTGEGPAYNPGLCPDWESNQQQQPFGSQASAQSTEPHLSLIHI